MDGGTLDKKITLWQRTNARDPDYNTPSGGWVPFAKDIWASVQDFLPSRGERVADGVILTQLPKRIRIRYRDGVDSTMRVTIGADPIESAIEIVAGPAELGRRDGQEFVAQSISTTGDTD